MLVLNLPEHLVLITESWDVRLCAIRNNDRTHKIRDVTESDILRALDFHIGLIGNSFLCEKFSLVLRVGLNRTKIVVAWARLIKCLLSIYSQIIPAVC